MTVLIPTYARTALLAEALESVKRQKYDGTLRAIVLNDCSRQTIRCDLPWVSVENYADRFTSIARKRNCLLMMARTEFITWLDDDDILLPWHCAQLDAEKHATMPENIFKICQGGGWSWASVMGGTIVTMVRTVFALDIGFSVNLHAGEDSAFRAEIVSRLGKDRIARPHGLGYIYRMGRQMHLSQSAVGPKREWSPEPFWKDAENRMNRGEEPTGEIIIKPKWQEEYGDTAKRMFPKDVPE